MGVALEEDEVAIIPAPDGRCGDNHRDESCIASDISKKRKDGDYNAETAVVEKAGEDAPTSITATNINNANKNIRYIYGKKDKSSKNAIFLQVEKSDELEIVELLRRIAELVVLSERRAGKPLYEAASSAVVPDAKNNNDDSDDWYDKFGGNDYGEHVVDEEEGVGGSEGVVNDSFDGGLATLTATIDKKKTSREGSKKTKIIHQRKQLPDYNNDEALPSLAPFELFCERNALANIVDIVTGAAFARQGERPPSRQLQSQLQQLWKLEEPVMAGVLPTSGQSTVTTAFERTMSIVLESEVEIRPSQDSRRASLERTKSAFIGSEGESDLDVRKEWLLQDSLKGDFGRSKSMQIRKSSDGNGSNRPTPLSSSNRPKPLSSRSGNQFPRKHVRFKPVSVGAKGSQDARELNPTRQAILHISKPSRLASLSIAILGKTALPIQRLARLYISKLAVKKQKKNIVLMQSLIRRWKCRRYYKSAKIIALRCKGMHHGMVA